VESVDKILSEAALRYFLNRKKRPAPSLPIG
jgi:hypothetical protein